MYKFLNLDMSTMTFKGLSRPYQRKVALVTTLFIWLGLLVQAYFLAHLLNNKPFLDEFMVLIFLGIFLHYALTGKLLFWEMSEKLFKFTPMGVLYKQDKSILDKGKKELLTISASLNFADYLEYGKINPAIRSSGAIEVFEQQKNGTLGAWVKKPGNLKMLADLVYQIYLVEQFLLEDYQSNGTK